MKFSKVFAMVAAASVAVGALADAANVLISFSTEADYYADGTTPVADGEWYALCWSPRETFGGLDLNYNPVKEDEAVLILAPLAKGGRCPDVVFQIDSAVADACSLDNGYYFVYVLDTRDANGKPAGTDPDSTRRIPVSTSAMNGAVAKSQSFAVKALVESNSSSVSSIAGRSTTAPAIAEADAAWKAVQPKITYFGVAAGKVNITVKGVMPGVSYKVKMGQSPNALTTYSGLTSGSDVGTIEFKDLDPDKARFFMVVGQ